MEKICTKCHQSKDIGDFPKSSRYKDGYNSQCKACLNDYNTLLRQANLIQYREKAKDRYWADVDKARQDRRDAYNPTTKSAYDITYRQANKEKIASYKKKWEKLHKDEPLFKIRKNLRRRIHHLLKDGYKSKHTEELLGCSFELFKLYIESKFQDGMTWENYGKWHLDHIRPCSSFDLTKTEEQLKCFNYSNQQPLWAVDNLKKSKKWQEQNLSVKA